MPKYEIILHGPDHPQYFPGCGTAFSDFYNAVTGCGYNAKEAYEDAVEQIFQILGEKAWDLGLPLKPRGIRKSDKLSADQIKSEWLYFVSIRW